MKFVLKVIGIMLLSVVIAIALTLGFTCLCKHIEILPKFVEFIENILDNLGINFISKIS